ncbi:MAG TPA: hypothetical protein VFQ78_07570 [Candidatus Udaeobacter sp.]|jgi:hypothetical protein|nr:hypothetical protein [Candidatus Udaeobacter sp.]
MNKKVVPVEPISQSIRWIPSRNVDSDIARPYGVQTKHVNIEDPQREIEFHGRQKPTRYRVRKRA